MKYQQKRKTNLHLTRLLLILNLPVNTGTIIDWNVHKYHTISLHDATIDYSTGFHQSSSILNNLYDTILRDIPILSEGGKNIKLLERRRQR